VNKKIFLFTVFVIGLIGFSLFLPESRANNFEKEKYELVTSLRNGKIYKVEDGQNTCYILVSNYKGVVSISCVRN
jgi:hypothetical protein